MKVSLTWLDELVDTKLSPEKLVEVISLHTYPIKELTKDYFELDIKGYNRPDLLSMRGVATEVAALTESQLKFSDPSVNVDNLYHLLQNDYRLNVNVKDEDLVPLYCLVKIEGLKAKPSNPEWVKKLTDCGMRSVNNIADVTNLVMLEYGQPLHAFDADKVEDEAIIVRLAQRGETLQTLDGKERELLPTDLLITDHSKVLGLAGVMGGKESEVKDSTTTILLEAAIFDPVSIRKTATRLGLPSEASKRFQHGLTKTRLLQAFAAAIKSYQNLGGRLTELTITGDTTDSIRKITLSQQKINSLIGVDVSNHFIEECLTKLHFDLATKGESLRGWEVTVPYFRLDIECEEDLIEEVARMYGYNKIPANSLPGSPPSPVDQSLFEYIDQTKTSAVKAGLTEVQTYSFVSTQVLNSLNFDRQQLIKIANPMSAETEYLRYHLWSNLVEVAAKNLKNGFDDIAIFEVGKVYRPTNSGPKENHHFSVLLASDSKTLPVQLWQIVQKLPGFNNLEPELNDTPDEFFHPVRFWQFKKDGQIIGHLAEVHPRILDKFGVSKRVATLEIDLSSLLG